MPSGTAAHFHIPEGTARHSPGDALCKALAGVCWWETSLPHQHLMSAKGASSDVSPVLQLPLAGVGGACALNSCKWETAFEVKVRIFHSTEVSIRKQLLCLKMDTEKWDTYSPCCYSSFRPGFSMVSFPVFSQLAGSAPANSQGSWWFPGDGIWYLG